MGSPFPDPQWPHTRIYPVVITTMHKTFWTHNWNKTIIIIIFRRRVCVVMIAQADLELLLPKPTRQQALQGHIIVYGVDFFH